MKYNMHSAVFVFLVIHDYRTARTLREGNPRRRICARVAAREYDESRLLNRTLCFVTKVTRTTRLWWAKAQKETLLADNEA